ncbi:hypothetical protein MMC20_000174 [Loxospora ochrophaea]|nr:hypothetical protein [Loxospora ochrophaea]
MAPIPVREKRKISPSAFSEEDSSPSTIVELSGTPANDFFTNAARWNLEQDYETRPRKLKKKDKENTRLPIKTAEGRVEQLEVPVIEEEQDSLVSSASEEALEQDDGSQGIEELPKVSARQQILDAKEELARIATLVNEDPEEHASSFKKLAQVAASPNYTVKKLALATQLAVYKDVIPGYRIRPLQETQVAEKVSKDVRRLRDFEQSLVKSYQAYINDLAQHTRLSRGDATQDVDSLATVATSCACTLLLAVPHFNFRGELLKILVDKLSHKRTDSDAAKCRETLETLFRDDEDGAPSLDAVTMLTKMMKAKSYNVEESVLNTLLHLRLLSEFSSKASQTHVDNSPSEHAIRGKKLKMKKEFRTKKQRKLDKERKGIEKEFKEADATVSHEERDRMQAETLKIVFVTYFRILKTRTSALMGAVLEGLAKYAHLINQDFFGDLLEALKDLTNQFLHHQPSENPDDDTLLDSPTPTHDSTRSSLLCLTTAFALLEGQDVRKAAPTLLLDLSFFITHLYRSIHSLALYPDIELSSKSFRLADPHSSAHSPSASSIPKINLQTTTVLLLRALSSILLPRSVPPIRLAAFSKKLLTASLYLPEKSATAVLGLMGNVVKVHSSRVGSLWDTEERKGDGAYDPEREDVEGSNPFASTIWEGELLRYHYAPAVREGVRTLERGVKPKGDR